ncbi:hypothetical protein LBMAG53_22000 [Planctomycetota bacterium]|nr:hypothetical protein LBMAG53_22000 [Planctomycetota bacterium]
MKIKLLHYLLIVFGLWIINLFSLLWVDNRGTIGDMFGVVNSLFSGCALAVLLYTNNLQKIENDAREKQRREDQKRVTKEFNLLTQQAELTLQQLRRIEENNKLIALTKLIEIYEDKLKTMNPTIANGTPLYPEFQPTTDKLKLLKIRLEEMYNISIS